MPNLERARAEYIRLDGLRRQWHVERLIRLVYSWGWESGAAGEPKATITVEWSPEGKATIKIQRS
jgi:hypothetical protein